MMTIRNKTLAALALLGLVMHSCVPTREVREAQPNLPAQYQSGTADTLNTGGLVHEEFFQDPALVALIDTALVRNQELNIATQRLAVLRNEVQARKGEYLPFLDLGLAAETEKVGRYTRNGAVEEQLQIGEGEAFPEPLSNYRAGLVARWELDVWKKLRNSKKAAALEYLASSEGRNFMVTGLVAEIASAYYELLALDNQLAIIEQNLEIQKNALEIVKLQKQAARATELAVRRFEAEVLKNRSQRYEIRQRITETENQINFMLGRPPQPIARQAEGFLDRELDSVHTGVPAQLLANRPDIRQAELELQAAKLDVRAARANFYPRVEIRAGLGLEAFKPRFLTTTPESVLLSAVGDVVAPLVNRNAIKAEYNSANARQLAAVFEYEKAILGGYIEVANRVSGIENLRRSYDLKRGQVEALTASIEISSRLFQSARADYMEVLLTQRDALEARIELVETKRDQLLARVGVYRALGGGWR